MWHGRASPNKWARFGSGDPGTKWEVWQLTSSWRVCNLLPWVLNPTDRWQGTALLKPELTSSNFTSDGFGIMLMLASGTQACCGERIIGLWEAIGP